jgi:DNA-3-methyladenine glycosylase
MFGPPGRAYVYLVYGMYHCLNVVTEPEGSPSAVLIRAVEPLSGLPEMREARARVGSRARVGRGAGQPNDDRLASGPGLVCAAFSITRTDDGVDLLDPAGDLRLEPAPADELLPVAASARIGIDYAPEPWRSKPWRFFVPGNASVSGRIAARSAGAEVPG